MSRRSFILTLAAGAFIAAVSLYGFVRLCRRAGLPPEVSRAGLVRVDGIEIRSAHYLNYALARKGPGLTVDLVVRAPDGGLRTFRARLVAYYEHSSYPVICLVIGLLALALGIMTFILKPAERKARLFFWLALFFSAAIIINSEEYGLGPDRWMAYLPAMLFILSYALVPALLLHFALTFSPPANGIRRGLLYLPGLFFFGIQTSSVLLAHLGPSLRSLRFYSDTYNIFRAYLVLFILAAIVHLFLAFRQSQEEEAHAQIKWTFFGLAVGVSPFVFLYQLPRALGLSVMLSEEVSNIFFIAPPLALAIAIVRYRLVDVSRVINRSLVYSLLTIFTVGVYLLVVQVAQGFVARLVPIRQGVFSAAGVLLAALAFHPAQRRIQSLVDRAFFRQRYDSRRVVFDFNERAREFASAGDLAGHFLDEVRRVLQVDTLGLEVTLRRPAGGGEDVRYRFGQPLGGEPGPIPQTREEAKVWARPSAVLASDLVEFTPRERPGSSPFDLAMDLPLACEAGNGRLGLGPKMSGRRYSREDIELLRTMAAELCIHLERILLQEEVIYERASREKLDELNRQKTEFIASVSHELRTPMSGIRGLAEVLQSGKLRSREQRERYLDLMVAESGRLSRFIHNVLDFGRIEGGAKSYNFRGADLKSIVEESVDVLRGAFEERGFRLDLKLPAGPLELVVDADAVKQALINLLDNAMKYSSDRKEVGVELREGAAVEILVKDRGIGISAEDRAGIFGPFFRAENAARLNPGGAGLGLKIVRHIMAAHGGEVRVKSEMGLGSTFILEFPRP